ncbi:hypothetical protein C8R46DRAFT_1158688 [Mycena filopes]|nr:hypothetical protein C8R46DRAFT_1158688 [Mycena filopes]
MRGATGIAQRAPNAGTRTIHRCQEAERLRKEQAARAEARRAAEVEMQRTARLARQAEQAALERVRQVEFEARRAKEATQTLQRIVLGTSLVTYGAGISIQQVVTGFEACRILIKNLPLDATENEIKAIFTQQGVDETRLFITGTKELPDGHLEATLITSSEEGGTIAVGLEDIEFRQERLHFEVMENAHGMGTAARKDCDTLTLSWRAPSSSVAEAKVKLLNRQICAGRRVRVEMNQPPPGYLRGPNWQCAIKITGLPSVVAHDVQVENIGGAALMSFDVVAQDDIEGNVSVKARFSNHDTAKRVEAHIDGRLPYLGNQSIRRWLPNPLEYIISIPRQQYQAQKRVWDSLADGEAAGNKKAFIRIFSVQNNTRMQIKVLGDDKKAVGSLKVRVENLVAGEQLNVSCWHRSFKSPAGARFLNSVFDRSGAYARADWKLCVVKVFGDAASVDQAREAIKTEVERLDSLESSVFLKKQSIRFFVRRGMATLKEALGEENATAQRWSTARRTVTDASCPICYDEISHPVTLGCGHTYCLGCLRHYISTAADTFPTPIPLPRVEHFLASFLRHIEQHPREFKYCKTPDCSQVYRCNTDATAITCPSCFFTVCSSCDEEGHQGISCEDKRLQSDPGEQERRNDEWARANGVKRCPACSVWIEKTEGCNHMTCKCGAHICWVCMRVFEQTQIYAHLNEVHGGFFAVPPEQRRPPSARAVQEANRRFAAIRLQEAARQQEVQEMFEADRRRRERELYTAQWRQQQRDREEQAAAARAAQAARRERQESGWGCVVM